jgi:hypothetical protein
VSRQARPRVGCDGRLVPSGRVLAGGFEPDEISPDPRDPTFEGEACLSTRELARDHRREARYPRWRRPAASACSVALPPCRGRAASALPAVAAPPAAPAAGPRDRARAAATPT